MINLFSEKLTEKNEKDYNVYKIKGKIYETDEKTFFSLGDRKLYENKTNDVIYFMLYDKRYLFIGYFPNTPQEIKLPFAYWDRILNKLDIVDLEDTSKKWTYQFDRPTLMKYMKKFDPKNGDILYCKNLKAEKK